MRTIAFSIAALLSLGLAACAEAGPDGGIATYDALHKAHDACAARGGTLSLKAGGDSRVIQDYACKGAS